MTVTRSHIFNRVSFYLKNEHKFFTSSEIQTIIGVDAFRRIAEDLDWPKTNYSAYVASGAWTVTMPAGFLKVDQNSQVVYKDATGTNELTPRRQTNIGRDTIMTATPGTPVNYFMEKESVLGLYPPSTSGLIVVPYVSVPTSLSSDSDTNELTEQCYMAAVYWTVAMCFDKDADARADKFLLRYEAEIQRLRKRYEESFEVDRDLAPSEDYVR
jgi:hypothetical protein